MAFIPPQGNKTVMVDNSNNIVYPASFKKVVATQATIAGNNFTSVPSVIDPENATTTQLPSVASVVNYVADVVEGGSSGLIPAIQSDIQTLGQVKSNRGEFWFNRGILTCANKWTTDSAFSLAFTFAMTQADWTSMNAMSNGKWIGTTNYGQPTGVSLFNVSGKLHLILNCEGLPGVSIYKNAIRIDDWANYLDGKSHCVVASFGNGSLAINIDGIEKGRLAIADFVPNVSQLPFSIRHYGQMSRIKYFDFDMSDANAPYTIADYIAGNDEPPFDYDLTTESTFTQRTIDSNLTLTDSSTNVGYIKFEAEPTSSAPYFWFPLGKTIKKGAKVKVSFDYKTYTGYGYLSVGFGTQGIFATTNSISTGANTITLSNDCDCIVFVGAQDTAIQCDIRLSAFANSSLLSLDDYSIKVGATQIVPDVSGNNNDATITGVVMGSKDNSIAKMAQLFYQSQQG